MKEDLIKIWSSRKFQISMDVIRILLLIIAVMIFIKLSSEIEAIKILMYDPCKICMNKTGAVCYLNPDEFKCPECSAYDINWTAFNNMVIKNES